MSTTTLNPPTAVPVLRNMTDVLVILPGHLRPIAAVQIKSTGEIYKPCGTPLPTARVLWVK